MRKVGWPVAALALGLLAAAAPATAGTGVFADEDWTDALFDDPGWFFMPDANGYLGATNDRGPEVPNALIHLVNPDGHWGVAMLELPADTIQAAADEVLVLKFTCFSDVARDSLHHYKVELACLHKNESEPYGHDHAIEASQNFSTGAAHNQAQLLPSVENNEFGLGRTAVRYAHVDGAMNATNLAEEYTSLVVFRPEGGATNVEQFGTRLSDDYDIPEAMYPYDQIQVSMPRNEGSGTVFAPGANSANAQKGMAYAHVGVTKTTDFNLDYATDAADLIVYNSFQGAGGKALPTGDADNDGNTDATDFGLWDANKGTAHDVAVRESRTVINVPAGSGVVPKFAYVPTGAMYLDTDGETLMAWLVEGPEALSTESQPGGSADWWQAYFNAKEQWADRGLGGFAGAGNYLFADFAAHLAAADFGDVLYGYAAGGGGATDVAIIGLGDTDLDGDVDATDLATLGMNWSPSPGGKTWLAGDSDGDGDVDATDLAALGMNWNPSGAARHPSNTDSGAATPEPAGLSLLGLGLGAALLRRRAGRRARPRSTAAGPDAGRVG